MPNWSLIEYTWRHWRGPALSWWDRLDGADWDAVDGNRERLLELLQERYGWTVEEAEQQVQTRFDEYASSLK